MRIDLSGRKAIISGSSAGIGLAVAGGLADAGCEVVINGRRAMAVEAACEKVREAVPGALVQGVAADLATAQGCAELTEAVSASDILVNNLGIYKPHDFFATDDDEWQHFFNANVMSGVRLARRYMPGMMEHGWGRVVFMASESALNIPVNMIHYGMSKAACLAVARGLAKRAAGTGVTVNSVLPGPTLSEGLRRGLEKFAQREHESIEEAAVDYVRHYRPSSILRRPTSPEEVANMVVYVCSLQASGTTGAALRVDGGVIDSTV